MQTSPVMRICLAGALLSLSASSFAASWTPVTVLAPDFPDTMLLLTDGSVIVHGAAPYDRWQKLTPSTKGSYVDGTWTTLAPMSTQRLYFASHVLPNGNLWVLGGEYSGNPLVQNVTRTGEVYDPVANVWQPIAPHPETNFGDDPSMLLSGGKILAGSIFTNGSWLYDIASNSWTFAASKVYADRSDEEGWVKLPDGRVLTYDLFKSIGANGQYAEVYNPVSNGWASVSPSDGSAGGFIPQLSSTLMGFELGPSVRLRTSPQGEVFIIGATGHTALYDIAANTWSAGPDVIGTLNGVPTLFGADDAPAAVLPDGKVLFAADAGPTFGLFKPPTQLFVFDPILRTIAPLSPAIPAAAGISNIPSFVTRMLMLPTGQALVNVSSQQLWIYTPDGRAAPETLPQIRSVHYTGGGLFQLSGKRLNGMSAGSAYGDDVESDENYPIVRLTSKSGNVLYARSTNWSDAGSGITTPETVYFKPNPATVKGRYRLEVSAAGIVSRPRCLFIRASDVAATPGSEPHEVELEDCEDDLADSRD